MFVPSLETERLLIRPFTMEDLDAIHQLLDVDLAETAFVSPSSVADVRLEFFTPKRRNPHCGHATITVFGYRAQRGLIAGPHSSKKTIDVLRDIFLRGELAFMVQSVPRYVPLDPKAGGVDRAAVQVSLGLGASDLLPGSEPMVVSAGMNSLMVPCTTP